LLEAQHDLSRDSTKELEEGLRARATALFPQSLNTSQDQDRPQGQRGMEQGNRIFKQQYLYDVDDNQSRKYLESSRLEQKRLEWPVVLGSSSRGREEWQRRHRNAVVHGGWRSSCYCAQKVEGGTKAGVSGREEEEEEEVSSEQREGKTGGFELGAVASAEPGVFCYNASSLCALVEARRRLFNDAQAVSVCCVFVARCGVGV